MNENVELNNWVVDEFINAVPAEAERDIAKWAERFFMPNSTRSDRFKVSITPWLIPLFEWFHEATEITNVKPVQSGGSTFGEIAITYLLATSVSGDIQYNWETNDKANDRWDKRFLKILENCAPVNARFPMKGERVDNTRFKRCLINFPHANFTMQGIKESRNIDSDSVRYIVNEELHNWEPGRLEMARHRMTAVYNGKMINISNAGTVGDQLHQAWLSSSQQHLEWRCPKCGTWQVPRTQWVKGKKGGLRYDSEGCKLAHGGYDYERLQGTLFYECENEHCDHRVYDRPMERRAMSDALRAGAPLNLSGAAAGHRGLTYEAICVYYIPWITLVKEKHEAQAALRYGNNEPWARYLKHRECKFWDVNERPFVDSIAISSGVRKGREGMPDRVMRGMTVDKQAGSAQRHEVPHFWCVIRDWGYREGHIISQLVWEGRIGLEEDVESRRVEYSVESTFVLVDSGYNAIEVYRLCARYGYTPIKGEPRTRFTHRIVLKDKVMNVERFYSPPTTIDAYEGTRQAGSHFVKLFLYSKSGIRNRLSSVRNAASVEWIVPEDVSDDYRAHMESEVLQEVRNPRDGSTQLVWTQIAKRNDLFVCECYQVLLAEMAGIFAGVFEGDEKATEPA